MKADEWGPRTQAPTNGEALMVSARELQVWDICPCPGNERVG